MSCVRFTIVPIILINRDDFRIEVRIHDSHFTFEKLKHGAMCSQTPKLNAELTWKQFRRGLIR